MDITLPQIELEKDVFEVKINIQDLILSKEKIGDSLGYSNSQIPSHFEMMINNILQQLPKRCEIRAGYRLLDVNKPHDKKDGLFIAGHFFKMEKIVTNQLKEAQKVALFVCTIGLEMENWTRQLLNNNEPTLSYLVDTIASETVENATDLLYDFIDKKMSDSGLKITNRYSPGYCNWPVSEQHLLFSLLPKNFCGITLTESALMLPIKSISGVIGVGEKVKRMDYFCDRCGVKDCTYRIILSRRTEHTKLQKNKT